MATIRPFNTFDPRQSARAVIPAIVTQTLTQPSIRLGNLTPIGKEKPIESDEQRLQPKDSEVERLCASNSKARAVLD